MNYKLIKLTMYYIIYGLICQGLNSPQLTLLGYVHCTLWSTIRMEAGLEMIDKKSCRR